MNQVSALTSQLSLGARFGKVFDFYPAKAEKQTIVVDPVYINAILGLSIATDQIISILERLTIGVEKVDGKLKLTIPFERLDLVIPEDSIEEVGRIYGYEKIKGILPPKLSTPPLVNKLYYYSEKIRNILINEGFSEVYLYTLVDMGDYEIEHPLASDKAFLRTELTSGLSKVLQFNARNAPLLGLEEVRIFEIGKVFPKKGEHTSLSFGIETTKNIKNKEVFVKDTLETIKTKLSDALGVRIEGKVVGNVFECDLDELVSRLPEPTSYNDIGLSSGRNVVYKKISAFPFVLRDIAVFVPEGITADQVLKLITQEGSELLVRTTLFDVFKKTLPDGSVKNSYAFKLVFQSMDRTLSDSEINEIMDQVTKTLNAQDGWQVR